MIQVLDNRNGQEGLEITADGYGKWYAYNPNNGKLVGCMFKYQAEDAKRFPNHYDLIAE